MGTTTDEGIKNVFLVIVKYVTLIPCQVRLLVETPHNKKP
jgi:hypothetical protein